MDRCHFIQPWALDLGIGAVGFPLAQGRQVSDGLTVLLGRRRYWGGEPSIISEAGDFSLVRTPKGCVLLRILGKQWAITNFNYPQLQFSEVTLPWVSRMSSPLTPYHPGVRCTDHPAFTHPEPQEDIHFTANTSLWEVLELVAIFT